MNSAQTQVEAEIIEALSLLCEPGQVVEARILNTSQATVSGYFDDMGKLAEEVTRWNGKAPGIYLTLNPANPALLSRSSNRLKPYAKQTTSDADIISRRWLPIDLDPVRPSGISSTDQEHEAALVRAQEIVTWLREQGWPAPILADSGNGVHVLCRIELPNSPESTKLIEGCLRSLAFRFDDAVVKVDLTTFNAARIWKTYGTNACKGDPTQDRPHRTARLINVPEKIAAVNTELLERLAALSPKEPKTNGQASFDVETWVDKSGLDIATSGGWQGGRKWILATCPWNPEHTNRSAYILQFPSGAVSAGCHHNGCADKNWYHLRDVVEPGWRRATKSGSSRDESKKQEPIRWVVSMDEIKEEKTEWLWKNRLAKGRMTIVGGDPGTGKTYVALAIAAAESRGDALPGGEKPASASNVLLISLEDGLPDVIKPRLIALNADQRRIAVPNPERNLPAVLINASAIEQMVKVLGPRLVILDPLMAFASGKNTREGSQMRQMLTPITALADRYAFALLVILHLNKGNSKAIYKFQESIDIVAQARSAFIVANDPSDRYKHVMAHAKTNSSIKTPSLSFWIREDGSFEWGEEVEIDAEELVSSEQRKEESKGQVGRASELLKEILASGPVLETEIEERAKAAGVRGSIWRAKKELRVRSIKEKVGWFWSLT